MRICGRVAVLIVDQRMYTSAQIIPLMYATARKPLRRRAILGTVKFRAKAIVQNASVRTGRGSVDYVDGFLD
jgi:hypothetical protein